MTYSKIVNPETNRPVNSNSKLGRSIIKNYIHQFNNNQLGGAVTAAVKQADPNSFYKDLTLDRHYKKVTDEKIRKLLQDNIFYATEDTFGFSGYHRTKPYDYGFIPVGIYQNDDSMNKARRIITNIYKSFSRFDLFGGFDTIISAIENEGMSLIDIIYIMSEFKKKIDPEGILSILPDRDHLNAEIKDDATGDKFDQARLLLSQLLVESVITSLSIKLGETIPNYINQMSAILNRGIQESEKISKKRKPAIWSMVNQRESLRRQNKTNTNSSMAVGYSDTSGDQGYSDQSYDDQGYDDGQYGGSNLSLDPDDDYVANSVFLPDHMELYSGLGVIKYFKDKQVNKTTPAKNTFERYKTNWNLIKADYISKLTSGSSVIKKEYKKIFSIYNDVKRNQNWFNQFDDNILKYVIGNAEQFLNSLKPGGMKSGN